MEGMDERNDSARQYLSGPQLVNLRDRTDLECCEKCQKISGTLECLQALLHEDGYEHINRQELEVSKAQGCPLCAHVLHFADENVTRTVTCIGTRILGTRKLYSKPINFGDVAHKEIRPTKHPFERIALKGLTMDFPYSTQPNS
jgi:hypothetical protein